MNKKELIEKLTKDSLISKEEIEKVYNEQVENWKKLGTLEGDALESAVVNATHARFKKHLKSRSETFIGIAIGISGVTDFGAAKRNEEAQKLWKTDPDKAIEEGWVNEDGITLIKGHKRELDLDQSKARFVYLAVKKEDEKEYKFATLRLNSKSLDMTIPMGLGQEIEFRANASDKSTDEQCVLNQANITEFKETGKTVDIKGIINTTFKSHKVKPSELREWHTANESDFNRFAIVKGTVAEIRETGEGINNVIELDSDELSFGSLPEENELITCWVPEEIPLNFPQYTDGLIVIGKTNINAETDQLSINAFGVIVPPEFVVERNDISESDIKEEHEETPKEEAKEESPKEVVKEEPKVEEKKEEAPKKEDPKEEKKPEEKKDEVEDW